MERGIQQLENYTVFWKYYLASKTLITNNICMGSVAANDLRPYILVWSKI